ncbi:cAMP-specific phosphodiesterase, putative, partial [Bodo saltans]
ELYSTVADSTGGNEIRFPCGRGIAGVVASTAVGENIRDAYQDDRFNREIDKRFGYRTESVLCEPIVLNGEVLAVAQLVNKLDEKSGNVSTFSAADQESFRTFALFAGISIANSHLLDRASLFLVDKERNELYSTVADSTGGNEIRFPCGRGIAGVVASTAVGENIRDAYQDDRFNREIDKRFGYRTESVLCEPIVLNGEVLAVAQLVNKLDEKSGNVSTFSAADQESFRTFALFAGISIANSHLLEFAVKAGKEAMELNTLRERGTITRRDSVKLIAVTPNERDAVLAVQLPDIDFTSRDFDLFTIRETFENSLDAAAAITMRILLGTGWPQKFGCTEEILLNFVIQCRRKYRKVPYHNFFHVVDVCQTLHTFLFHGGAKEALTELECFILLATALVHDLDHMGVNNSFHLKTDSPLGILSSASGNNSVLEVHHCNLAIEILGDPESNIFAGLNQHDLTFAYRGLIDCVLATDMARHGEMLNNYIAMVANNEFNIEDETKRRMVMMMILKAGDISNVTKPFPISRKWATAVTEEFYQQGDMEKAAGVDVLPMFDRQANNELAKGQLGFIGFVAKRFFDNLSTGPLAGMQWATDMVTSNRDTWQGVLDNKVTV